MKRLLATIIAFGILVAPAAVLANPANWTSQLSTPFAATSGKANTKSFSLSVSATSVNQAEILTVNVLQNGTLIGNFSDTASTYGGSWSQAVTVTTDGIYTFSAITSNSNGDPAKTVEATVNVDTTAPAAPTYLGKTQSGNTYAVKFTAPSSADVSEVRIYAATTTSFTANSSTQVGKVSVTPGQSVVFSYSSPDSSARYFAVQAFDGHGNASALSGDSVVTPGSAVTTANNTTSSTGTSTTNSSTTTTPVPAGLVESTQKKNDASKKDSTRNIASADKKKTDWNTVAVTLALLGALYVGYQWFMQKADKE